jgi:regulatory protein
LTVTRPTGDCYLAALRLLTGRDFTVRLLLQRLLQKGFSRSESTAAVERLEGEGYLQDRRFAERFVSSARETGRFVGYRLRQELMRRGVDQVLADELLHEEAALDDQLECAQGLLKRRYPAFDPQQSDDRERRRVAGFLQRRGYGGSVVRMLVLQGIGGGRQV